MAGKSIYDVEYSQEQGMPSDVLDENDYTQDVFFQTRPEVFDFDNRDRGEEPSQGDPFFRDRDMDEDIKYQENSLDRYNQKPQNWNKQRNTLINPYDRSDKHGSAFRVVDAYLKESATPSKKDKPKPFDPKSPEALKGKTPTLAKLMRYTSDFSKKNLGKVPKPHLVQSDPNNLYWKYKVGGTPVKKKGKSHTPTYTIEVQLEKKEGMRDFREMPVKVNCSCPFWKYRGPDFNSGRGVKVDPYRLGPSVIDKVDSKGDSVNPAPNVRDPGRENLICKHVAAVGEVFQKFAAEHNLDTYKQVSGILDQLEKQEKTDTPEMEIEGVKAIVDKMERSSQKEIQPLIDRYEKEDNPYRKERMKSGILMRLEDNIETEDKGWLQKILEFITKFFKLNKNSSARNASVERVLDMYLKEI